VNGDYRLEYRWLIMRNCIVGFKVIEEIFNFLTLYLIKKNKKGFPVFLLESLVR